MNDCLAATGSTGIDPLIGALALLLLGAGIAALAWRHRKRGAAGIALLPLVLGVLLFGNVAVPSAQAAECPPPPAPPAACVPVEIESVVLEGDVNFDIWTDEVTGISLSLTDVQSPVFLGFFDAVFEQDPEASSWSTLTFTAGETSVTLYADGNGEILSADPALPEGFDDVDVWDLIAGTLDDATDVPGVLVVTFEYETGCGLALTTLTVNGAWSYPID